MADCCGKCDATTRKTTVWWPAKTYEYKLPNETTYLTVTEQNPTDALDKAVNAEVDAYIKQTEKLVAPGPPACEPECDCLCFLSAPKFYRRTGTHVVSGSTVVQKSYGPVTVDYRATVHITIDIAIEEGICKERLPGMAEDPWQPPEFPAPQEKFY